MKPTIEPKTVRHTQRPAMPLALILFLLIGSASTTFAQSVITPLQPNPLTATTDQTQSPGKPVGAPTANASATDLRWGPIDFHPHVSYRYLYGNGIQASPGNTKKTEVHNFSPGLFANLRARWTVDFTPTWTYYSSSAFRDTVNQVGQINWATKYEVWTLSAAQTYSKSDSPLVETGSQTKQTSYTTNFNAAIAFNSRYALETNLTQSLNFTEAHSNVRTWSVRDMLHRRISSRLDTALGIDYSYTAVDRTPDMASLQFLGNLTWRVIDQLNMSLMAGLENREIYAKPTTSKQNPVYSASIQFIPVATTQLGFTASRSSSASFLDGQIMESTRYGFTLNQRLLKRLQFSASLSHQESKYTATSTSTTAGRADKIDSLNLGLNTTFLTRLRTGLTYQYNRNTSNVPGFTFASNQIGVDVGYTF